jgi:hypothetical protein
MAPEGREKIGGLSGACPRLRPGRHLSSVTPSIDRYEPRSLRCASNGAKCGRFGLAPVCPSDSTDKLSHGAAVVFEIESGQRLYASAPRLRNHGDPSPGAPWSLATFESGVGCVTRSCRSSRSLSSPRARLRIPRWRQATAYRRPAPSPRLDDFLGLTRRFRWRPSSEDRT